MRVQRGHRGRATGAHHARISSMVRVGKRHVIDRGDKVHCYAQALGVVDVGSLLVELSWRLKVRSGRPSCRASQGQNHGVRRGYKVSGEVRQSA